MKNLKLIGLLLLIGAFISCNNDDDATSYEANYLIFGHFYGMCAGESCVETFKLTDDKLFEDTKDDYTKKEFSFAEQSDSKFEQVKDLPSFIPNQLLNEKDSVFGCPDCADAGGLFIRYLENGNVKSWRIDQVKANVPEYLHSFMDKVNEKIELINN
ncbi:hypothetical protein [Galbibacter sp. EGI 63066]|uniref:hypothetical protein n=1 Tax=Galbibacter sp. EGI 63066 TaxID=2993559 RepID=UPI002248841B|nr:hypothetical protein [Galbibacter sp. EGI 63066]